MEKIEVLVEVLGKFGDALGNVKVLIGDIEDEVKKHTTSLKLEIENFKKTAYKGESWAKLLSKEEADLRERMSKLRTEIQSLEKPKKIEGEKRSQTPKTPATNVSVKSYPSIEDVSEFNDGLSIDSKNAFIASYVNKRASLQANVDLEWWKNADVHGECEEEIDWVKEKADRAQFKLNLMVSEGWRKQNSSFEELQEALRAWTGRLITWTVVQQGRATRNGKTMFSVKFNSEEDRDKIFAMRKKIAEEGVLMVGEALTYIERRERWKMLTMADKLKYTKDVEFENRRICVDGQWWKYCFAEGWRKL